VLLGKAESFTASGWLRAILREADALRRHDAELLELAREHRLGFWRALATPFLLKAEEAERAMRGFQREWPIVHLCSDSFEQGLLGRLDATRLGRSSARPAADRPALGHPWGCHSSCHKRSLTLGCGRRPPDTCGLKLTRNAWRLALTFVAHYD
jgi:hypothetical protein